MDKSTKKRYFMLLISGMMAVLLICFREGISGNDFWWHLKVGEWICKYNTVPRRDIFSWYGVAQGFTWTAHEWLSEVIYWLIYRNSGEGGIFLFSVGMAVLMMVLIVVRIRQYFFEKCLMGTWYIFMFCILESLFFYGRPHVFSYFLLYGELYCLYEYAEDRKKWCLYILPLLTCLWSNLHGGSSNLSYLLVFAVLLCGIREWHIGRIYSSKWSRRQCLELSAVFGMCIGAVCIQPAGFEMLLYPYRNMADMVMLRVIGEWAAPDAKNIGELVLYFVPIVFLCFGFLAGEQRIRLLDVIIVFFFLFLFFRSVRFIMYFYIAAAFGTFSYQLPCKLKSIKKRWEKAGVWCLELLLLITVGIGMRDCVVTWKQGGLISTVLDEQVLEVVKKDAPARLFNDYNYGGALIFQDIPVFIDGRADVYLQDHLLAESVSLMNLQQRKTVRSTGQEEEWEDVEALIEKYDFDAFLIERERPLFSYLASHEDWYEAVLVTEETGYFRRKQR